MKSMWEALNRTGMTKQNRSRCFLCLQVLLWSGAGLLVWSVIQIFALRSLAWAFCFAGYAGFFLGFVRGVLFLWRE